MANKDNQKTSLQNVKKLKISLIIGYAVIVIAAVVFVSMLAVKKTDSVLKNKVSSMASSSRKNFKWYINIVRRQII